MPTVQEKHLLEKRMNTHWDRLAKQRAVLHTRWAPDKNNGVGRREHHVLHDKRVETENRELYKRLCRIENNKMSRTEAMIASSGDTEWLDHLRKHRAWQRDRDIEERHKDIDKKNLTLYHALVKMKSKIQPREEMLKEYEYNHEKVENSTRNKVKDVELHLNIRRFKDYEEVQRAHSPQRPKTSYHGNMNNLTSPIATTISPVKNGCSRKKITKPILSPNATKNHVSTEGGRMPTRFRQAVRPASAGHASKSKSSSRSRGRSASRKQINKDHNDEDFMTKQQIKEEIRKVYKLLAQQAAVTVTSDDIETYVSDHHYDHNVESEVYKYVYGEEPELISPHGGHRNGRLPEHPANTTSPARVAKTLFETTSSPSRSSSRPRSPYLEKIRNKDSPPKKPSPKAMRVVEELPSSSISVEPEDSQVLKKSNVSRRHLFSETQLTAFIRVDDHSESDNGDLDAPDNVAFVIRMFDVGQDCDLQLLTPVPMTSSSNDHGHGEGAENMETPPSPQVVPPMSPISPSSK